MRLKYLLIDNIYILRLKKFCASPLSHMSSLFIKIIDNARSFFLLIMPSSWMTIKGKKSNSIYLTFDDGPDPEVTPLLLDLLKKKNAKATFFLVGTKIEAHPELVSQIIANGHGIGNHSYDHNSFH